MRVKAMSKRFLPICFGLLALLALLTSAISGTASASSIHAAATRTADTSSNIHAFLLFDGHITDPGAVASRYDFVSGAKYYNVAAYRAANPNIFLTYYMTFNRDNGTFTNNQARLSLSQWQAMHPDWVLYKCDRRTPAYEYGDPNMPLDFSNPAVIAWQVQTYALQASQIGYNGITADNLNLENLFGACGTYQNGKWVQRYSGKYDDNQWRADVDNWVAQMQTALHSLPQPLALLTNFGFGESLSPSDAPVRSIVDHSDGILDESGFTHYGTYPLTNQYWMQSIELSHMVQAEGKPYLSVNNLPVVNRTNIQWALASYLMAKEHQCEIFISGTQQYGIDAWLPEYNAQIGAATDEMRVDHGIAFRDFTNGLSMVNPSSYATIKVKLSAAVHYVDMYGNPVGPYVTMAPHSGLVLLYAPAPGMHRGL